MTWTGVRRGRVAEGPGRRPRPGSERGVPATPRGRGHGRGCGPGGDKGETLHSGSASQKLETGQGIKEPVTNTEYLSFLSTGRV